MDRAVAIANNDVACLAWNYDKRIPGCLGFAVYRVNVADGSEEPLPAWVGFPKDTNADWKAGNTARWPVQRLSWRDLTAKRGGTYRYRIVPMAGTPGHLVPADAAELKTGAVTLAAERGDIDVYFNRGILSTQALTRAVPKGPSGKPNPDVLRERIDQPGDPLRKRLSGELPAALLRLLERAERDGGTCYCALYELNDTELLAKLLGRRDVHIVLSESSGDDETNHAARQALHEDGADVVDRMLGSGHIGHNKFVVYVDGKGVPRAVLTGSTNWTSSALCAQSNNAIVIESRELAQAYLDYWKMIRSEDGKQSSAFRRVNRDSPVDAVVDGGATGIRVWFSPNTDRKTKPAESPERPVDLEEVFDAITEAKYGVLFLAFIPGSPSILDAVRSVQLAKPDLFVRGALTDVPTAETYVDLYHRDGGQADARVVPAVAIPDAFGSWQAELGKLGHAVIHDKVVVIDPFTPECVVVTGSHNLGYKASYANDENLVMIRRNVAVAEAYAAHALDLYDHYRWRYRVQKAAEAGDYGKAWRSLSDKDDWQDPYFAAGSQFRREQAFWERKA